MYDLLQCVDGALDSFGSKMKQAVYWTLMSKETILSDRILANPDAFICALKEVFREAYPLTERSIIREIKKTFELRGPSSSYRLQEAFELASKNVTAVSELVITT